MTEHPSWSQHIVPNGEPILGKTYRADGWAYVDPPGRFSPEAWDYFLDLFGREHIVIIIETRGKHPSDGLPFARGQFLVSPEGWAKAVASLGERKEGPIAS